MAVTIRASEKGLKIIDEARRKKGWKKDDQAWCDLALTTKATLKRFWTGRDYIIQDVFRGICEAVEKNWEEIVDSPNVYEIGVPTKGVQLPSEAKYEILYPKQNSVIERTVEVLAITENVPEDLQKWLVVYAPGAKKFYPNEIAKKESEWKESIIVGSVDCAGCNFKILLFITNIDGSIYLKSFSDGAKELPPGVSFEVVASRAYRSRVETAIL